MRFFSLMYFLITSNGLLFSSLKRDPLVFFARPVSVQFSRSVVSDSSLSRPVSVAMNSFSFYLSDKFTSLSIMNHIIN